jgi:KUP system potassium uptake protein
MNDSPTHTAKSAALLGQRERLALTLGAVGVVYGNIGTSPLYAMREAFHGPWAVAVGPENVLGVLSLMIWAMVLVIAVKYLAVLLRADHHGQGGIIALLTILIPTGGSSRSRILAWITTVSLFGAALLYGDGVITPAMSVLSAVEGLELSAPGLTPLVIPLTLGILIALFAVQNRGTGRIGAVFGPIVLVWFVAIGLAGVWGVAQQPRVLEAFDPTWAARFFAHNGAMGFLVLSAVVLVVTGGEALYADLGHFGRSPIRLAGFAVALPALVLNYLGQGALLLDRPDAAHQPFYELIPAWGRFPMIALATAATVVASQALITACYSLTQQLVNLGYIPRVRIIHTSARIEGQIYVPQVNTFLMVSCIVLVLVFRDSSRMAAAYGLAVVGTMLVTTVLFYFVARRHWGWGALRAGSLAGCFALLEVALLGANLMKLAHGAWIPLVVGAALYTLMSTWRRGRELLSATLGSEATLPAETLVADLAARKLPRVPGTAVFMTRLSRGLPQVLLHHLKHNRVLHQRVILLTVESLTVPEVAEERRLEVVELGEGLYRVIVRHGFMESPRIAAALAQQPVGGEPVELARTSFYLGRETILPSGAGRMAQWRKRLFGVMSRNSDPATIFFGLPPNRVVELGTQVAL